MQYTSALNLPPVNQFAVYRDREFPYGVVSPDVVWLEMDRADYLSFPRDDLIKKTSAESSRLGVDVPKRVISRFFSRELRARWFGEPVSFFGLDEETVEIYYDRNPRLAELMGLKGNQYDGFRAHVPFAELQDIEVIITPRSVYDWWGTDFPDGPPEVAG